MNRRIVLVLALLCCSVTALAQQRPLQTEDPETIGAGRILLEGGLDYKTDVYYPLSGLRGDLFAVPTLGISIGVSSIAEIQIDGGLYQKLSISERVPGAPLSGALDFEGDTTSDIEDLNIGAKIRFLSEAPGRPAMAVRFSTRLPNSSNESGLGKDVQDFSASLAFGKTIQSVRVVGNFGMLILGNPTKLAAQDDLLAYSLSVARAVSATTEIVGEFAGRANFADIVTPGAEDRGVLRFGARYTVNGVRLDAGILIGLTPRDPEFGFTGGFTWVFDAFKVP
jgi:Putative MetA-pathway of phenol degradation